MSQTPSHFPRRDFLVKGVAFSLGFAGLSLALGGRRGSFARTLQPAAGFGPLVKDPARILDLPEGFSYRIIARAGTTMSDGLIVPGRADAMAAFAGPPGKVLLVCNHELEASWSKLSPFGVRNQLLSKLNPEDLYDAGSIVDGLQRPSIGGTTTLVYDIASDAVDRQFLSLAGTNRNCAGGPTPWGTWLSCEEDAVDEGTDGAIKRHGYCFEVVPTSEPALSKPTPLLHLGRFMHEACCVDPRTGIVYLSEDRSDGLLYRFLPDTKPSRAGDYEKPGRLQALCIEGAPSRDTGNRPADSSHRTEHDDIALGTILSVRWIDLDDIQAPKDDLRKRGFDAGAARFARGEGMWWGHGGIYFAATTGGKAQKGQLWKYTPSAHEGEDDEQIAPGTLELFLEPNDAHAIENADNITVAPWGDLIACEDGAGEQIEPDNRLIRVTPEGECSILARNAMGDGGEFAGACFSPDGSTLFVNLQAPGYTLAIRGPWERARVRSNA